MFEKVNPSHPDKIADRIAGALVDMAYKKEETPRIAVEVLIGHGLCTIIAETSVELDHDEVCGAVNRIAGEMDVRYEEHPQDPILSSNQDGHIRCGDNGIFRGVPVTEEQQRLSAMVRELYEQYPTDGKYILDGKRLIACQSCMPDGDLDYFGFCYDLTANPLGYWSGGTDVDTGATNRKLGSDMGDAVTGGGLHGKDLSKADVAVNVYAFIEAQRLGRPVEYTCAIGDAEVDGRPYGQIVEMARGFIEARGGFEKFAEWGLI